MVLGCIRVVRAIGVRQPPRSNFPPASPWSGSSVVPLVMMATAVVGRFKLCSFGSYGWGVSGDRRSVVSDRIPLFLGPSENSIFESLIAKCHRRTPVETHIHGSNWLTEDPSWARSECDCICRSQAHGFRFSSHLPEGANCMPGTGDSELPVATPARMWNRSGASHL